MKFCSHSREVDKNPEGFHASPVKDLSQQGQDSTLVKTIGWVSAALGAVALGLFVGRELRLRYKFNHRTPYDFYAHAGDEEDVDFGLGI